jgi:probable HAF family extracellular repeat protein
VILGNLPGSGAGAINNNGQVVGVSCVNDPSCDTTNPEFMARAYLWQNGTMDLNSLVAGGEPLYLIFATQISDAGEIIGFGATHEGDIHAFSATPIHNAAPSKGPNAAERELTAPIVLSEGARTLLGRRLPFGRFASSAGRPLR